MWKISCSEWKYFSIWLSDKDQKWIYIRFNKRRYLLEETDSNEVYEIDVKALDSFDFDDVKLIKIDGEGMKWKFYRVQETLGQN